MKLLPNWIRDWRRDTGLAAAVVVTLALGLGLNIAIFSAIDAILLRSLPVPHASQIELAQNGSRATPDPRFAFSTIERLRRAWTGKARIGAFTTPNDMYTPAEKAPPKPIAVQLVSGGYFNALAIQPWRGRLIGHADDRAPEGAPVCVVSYGYWRRQPQHAAVGKSLILNHVALTIVGIAPREFYGLDKGSTPEAWIPVRLQPRIGYHSNADTDSNRGPAHMSQPWATQPGIRWLHVVARVEDQGAIRSLGAMGTAADQRGLAPYLHLVTPQRQAKLRREQVWLIPGAKGMAYLSKRLHQPLLLLLAMSGLVLFIACMDVAMLLAARGVRRERETAVQLALGAEARAIVKKELAGSFALALAGTGLGLLLALWARHAFFNLLGARVAMHLDFRILGFAAAISALTALLAGGLPAWRRGHTDLMLLLRSNSSGLVGGSRMGAGRWLVTMQVALTLVLLLGAALLARSLERLMQEPLGISRRTVVAMRISPRAARMPRQALPGLIRIMTAKLGALPGARGAALAFGGALIGSRHSGTITLLTAGQAARHGVYAQFDSVTPGFFHVMGMRLLRGREFTNGEGPEGTPVVVVNRRFARRYLGGENPLGAAIRNDGHTATVIGVVSNTRTNGPIRHIPPMIYYSMLQLPGYPHFLAVRAARAALAPELEGEIRGALTAVAPGVPATAPETLYRHVAHFLRGQRSIAELSGGFALLALVLAGLGLYGLLAYMVTQRGNEIGIRMALGARPRQILFLVLSAAVRLVATGLAIGIILALPALGSLRSQLYGLSWLDPRALMLATGGLMAIALLAAYLPARRATRIAPWQVLHRE